MFPEYKMGIDAVDGDRVPSFDEMRAAIDKGRRDSALIAQALRQAEYLGLSGEDKYVLLAYQALIHLEDSHKRLMRTVSLIPNPNPIMIPDGNEPQPSRRSE